MSLVRAVVMLSSCSVTLLLACGEPQAQCGDQACAAGQTCELGECRSPCPCVPGFTCVDALCYPASCGGEACPAGEVCIGGQCGAPGCGGESCAPRRCDPAKGECVACTANADCGGATPHCNLQSGQCECSPGAVETCNDQDDDDCDGLVDCADPDCSAKACGASGATCTGSSCVCPGGETRELTCGDGEDNDCDGLIDCGDPDCAAQTCRAATDLCDAAEVCTEGVCPADGFLPEATLCRAGAPGSCDVAEQCTGTSASCPDDGVAPQGMECRAAEGECDQAEVCDGTSSACPTDGVREAGTVCSTTVRGACDLPDTCDGTAKTCQPVLVDAGTVCRPKEGPCDTAEACNGATAECPPDQVLPSDVLCRPAEPGAPCGLPEYCPGNAKLCPDDQHAVGTVCRAANGICDAADLCDGTSAYCGNDTVKPATEVCRPSTDLCDEVDFCDGAAKECGADTVRPSGTTCRVTNPSLGCDAPDRCDGYSKQCAESFAEVGILCRPAVGECDLAERCTGRAADCPANAFADRGTTCRADMNDCTADSCDGAGACEAVVVRDGTRCGGYGGQCCGLACVDLNTDWQNCGSCGNVCADDQNCCNGRCDPGCF